jgi:hypothetical protein
MMTGMCRKAFAAYSHMPTNRLPQLAKKLLVGRAHMNLGEFDSRISEFAAIVNACCVRKVENENALRAVVVAKCPDGQSPPRCDSCM